MRKKSFTFYIRGLEQFEDFIWDLMCGADNYIVETATRKLTIKGPGEDVKFKIQREIFHRLERRKYAIDDILSIKGGDAS